MDFESFAWEIRPDGKLHFFSKNCEDRHLTFQPGTRSGVLDLHETSVSSDGKKSYSTLFMIKREDVIKLTAQLGPVVVGGLIQEFRPLSLRWLKRRKIIAVRHPGASDAEVAAITLRNKRKRLQFTPQMLQGSLETTHRPDALLHMSDGMFSLLAVRPWGTRCIGVGIKATDRAGGVHLLWARPEELLEWIRETTDFVMEAAAKHLILREDYQRYAPF
jgi:hypothetical protein